MTITAPSGRSLGLRARRGINTALLRTTGYELRRRAPRPRPPVLGRVEGLPVPPPPDELAELVARARVAPRLLTAPTFILSSVRSGSTLLRLVLDSHPQICSPHELHLRRVGVRMLGHGRYAMETLGLDDREIRNLLWDRVLAELVAAGTPVLPMRFGAVVADEQAVVDELLLPHRDQFVEALGTLTGRVQYTVRVQYEEAAVLRQVLTTRPDLRRLRDQAAHDRSAQLRLGELVVRALEQLRPADASAILSELIGTVDVRVHEPSAPEEVLHAAFLVDVGASGDFERRVEKAAEQRAGRTRFRLVGPTAAYDFVGDA